MTDGEGQGGVSPRPKPVARSVDAFCAIGRADTKPDIDLVRRSISACQHAATCIDGWPWRHLSTHLGWKVVRVRVTEIIEGVEPGSEPAAPPPPKSSKPRAERSTAPRGKAGKIPLLQCGAL